MIKGVVRVRLDEQKDEAEDDRVDSEHWLPIITQSSCLGTATALEYCGWVLGHCDVFASTGTRIIEAQPANVHECHDSCRCLRKRVVQQRRHRMRFCNVVIRCLAVFVSCVIRLQIMGVNLCYDCLGFSYTVRIRIQKSPNFAQTLMS